MSTNAWSLGANDGLKLQLACVLSPVEHEPPPDGVPLIVVPLGTAMSTLVSFAIADVFLTFSETRWFVLLTVKLAPAEPCASAFAAAPSAIVSAARTATTKRWGA